MIHKKIKLDYTNARKEKDEVTKLALSYIVSTLSVVAKNEQVDLLDDKQIIPHLKKLNKQIEDETKTNSSDSVKLSLTYLKSILDKVSENELSYGDIATLIKEQEFTNIGMCMQFFRTKEVDMKKVKSVWDSI